MIEFTEITLESETILRRYYAACRYRLSDYSAGLKLMWRKRWGISHAEACGCLVIKNQWNNGGIAFDYPVPLPDAGDVDGALEEIDRWCRAKGIPPAFVNVPEEERWHLAERYPFVTIRSPRLWQDYLYRREDLTELAGRHYAGQRNHINKFTRLYPTAQFRILTAADKERIEAFWQEFDRGFQKKDALAQEELAYAKEMMTRLDADWVKAGGMELEGRLIALAMGEVCGQTLICHIEKGLVGYEGVYPTLTRAFNRAFGQDCLWVNREDDAGDIGLRTSKLQYLPACMGGKIGIEAKNELTELEKIPTLTSERLTLDELGEQDREVYQRLCLDDDRNRWWGYDYRTDLQGELTEGYFLAVARCDFDRRLAVNFAVRLDGVFIGEAVLYDFDYRGSAELGCRILPEYARHGYRAEAFRCVAEWSLYRLGLRRLRAKCCRENQPSYRMLSACMCPAGEDEQFYYFEKRV